MLKQLEQWFVKANGFVVGTMMFLMFLLVFSNVVTRYVFGFSMNWAEEVTRVLMIWTAYLGAGLAMREGQHVAIEVIQEMLPKSLNRLVRALVGILLLSFMGFLAYLGYQYSQFAMTQETAVLQIPTGLIYLAIPIGSLAFILHLVVIFRAYIEKELADDQTAGADEAAGGSQA